MKSIVAINTNIPTVEEHVNYFSGASLRDHDIAIFDPLFPYRRRIEFDGGGSCLTVEATAEMSKAIKHWASELGSALKAGKTVFVILNEYTEDQGATGSTLAKNQRTYSTVRFHNYQAIPGIVQVQNARGQKIVVANNAYGALYEALKDISHYRVITTSGAAERIFTARDGSVIGSVVRYDDHPGALVLLPYFDFDAPNFTARGEGDEEVWTAAALKKSRAVLGQLVAIDKFVRGSCERSPPPKWAEDIPNPELVRTMDENLATLDRQLDELQKERTRQLEEKAAVVDYSHLLYETGRLLERAVENTLRLLGYSVETLRIGDLEIDHVIVGPSGARMIGETEGKDSSAIDISKFRQLESNIGEDFQREEVEAPAKGILFGNGFRLTHPTQRAEQFTQKSLINANRLGSALVRTADLYPVAAYLIDHPDDEEFKLACRRALEETVGSIVELPTP